MAAFNRKLPIAHTAPVVVELKACSTGVVSRCDARIIGEVVRDLGGGRLTKDSVINYEVGLDCLAKPGESVSAGARLARAHAINQAQADNACTRLTTAFEISTQAGSPAPLIAEIITAELG